MNHTQTPFNPSGRYRITDYRGHDRYCTTAGPAEAQGHLAAVPPHLQRLFEAGLSIRLPFDTFIQKIKPEPENYDG